MGTANHIKLGTQLPEENIMSLLDVHGVKEQDDIKDDKMSFLTAIRTLCIAPEIPNVPTWKMHEAVFQILRDSKSLELTISSYELLNDLEKHFPRVTVSKRESKVQVLVNHNIWSPFLLNCAESSSRMVDFPRGNYETFDSLKLFLLIKELESNILNIKSTQDSENFIAKMLTFVYLVQLLERDFSCRFQAFKYDEEWPIIRDSLLNQLLGSQRTSYLNFVKSSLYIVAAESDSCEIHFNGVPQDFLGAKKFDENVSNTNDLVQEETKSMLYSSVKKLLTMMMEIDAVKKEADDKGWTSRADGSRTPVLDIIIDTLSYEKEKIDPFLQAMTDPKWKLTIVLTYFLKHLPRTYNKLLLREAESISLCGLLKTFTDITSIRSITRRLNVDVIQFLLVHGFQAYLAQNGTRSRKSVPANYGAEGDRVFQETCKYFITAFENLQCTDEYETSKLMIHFILPLVNMKYEYYFL